MWVNIYHKLYNLDKYDVIQGDKTADGKTYLSLSNGNKHEVRIQMKSEDKTRVMMGITALSGDNK